jgi:hypothetical protein
MRRRGALWLVALMTLAAFALRLHDITGRSLWSDESFTLLRIQGSWSDLLTNVVWRQSIRTLDLHPPLYFGMLKLWTLGAAGGDFALRLFSVCFATLSVPLGFVLGRRVVGTRAGLLTALFVLTCPLTQWYGCEVRNYGMAEAFGALLGILTPLIGRPAANERRNRVSPRMAKVYAVSPRQMPLANRLGGGPTAWAPLFVATIAAVLVHYSFAGFAFGQIAALAALGLRERLSDVDPAARGRMLRALAWTGAALLLVLAVLYGLGFASVLDAHVLSRVRDPRGAFYNPARLFSELTGAMAFGLNAADPTGGVITIALAIAACAGLLTLTQRYRLAVWGALLGTLGMWTLLALLLENQPSFRYVIMLTPLIYLGLAALIDQGWRARRRVWPPLIGLAAGALMLGAHAHGLLQTFARTPSFEDDWRAVARHIREAYIPGDIVLLNITTPEAVLRQYLGDADMPFVTFSELNSPYPVWAEAARNTLAQSRRVWLLNTGGIAANKEDIARWLPEHTVSWTTPFPARTTVIELDLRTREDRLAAVLPAGAQRIDGAAVGDIRLAGFMLLPGGSYSEAGNARLLTYWQRTRGAGASARPPRLALRLRARDREWFTHDFDPALESVPGEWAAGGKQYLRGETLLPLPRGLPPLDYSIGWQVYAASDRASVQKAESAVEPGTRECCISVSGDTNRPPVYEDQVKLARVDAPMRALPGQPLAVAFTWWRTLSSGQPGPHVLALRPRLGAPVAQREIFVGAASSGFPLDQWPAMRWIRETQTLDVPFGAPPGRYVLTLGRRAPGFFDGAATLGEVEIVAYPASPIPTRVPLPLEARAGELTLLGLDLPELKRGQPVDIMTLWRVDATPARDGVLFLHVVNPDGSPGPQDDNPPERGARSTRSYSAGDGITQAHRITLPENAAPGEYLIYVGVYDRDGFERWPAQQNGASAKDNLILAGRFTLN